MKILKILAIFLGMVSLSSASDLVITNALAKKAQKDFNGAVFLKIKNISDRDRLLVSAKSSIAKKVQIHNMSMKNGVMKMSRVKSLKIGANSIVNLSKGGYHIMLIGLKKDLKVGDHINVILLFKDKTKVTVEVLVKDYE